MHVLNYFGNPIEVTDLEGAISQAEYFVGNSESRTEETDVKISSKDGRITVRGLVFYNHLLDQLLKLRKT